MIEGWPPDPAKKYKNKNKNKPPPPSLPPPPPPQMTAAETKEENNNSSNLFFPFYETTTKNNYNINIPENDDVINEFLLHDHHSSSSSNLVLSEFFQPILEPPDMSNWSLLPPDPQPLVDLFGLPNNNNNNNNDNDDFRVVDDLIINNGGNNNALDINYNNNIIINEYSSGNYDEVGCTSSSGVNYDNGENNNNNLSLGFGSPLLEPLPASSDSTDLLLPQPAYILLREISHSNGNEVRNLEIYGTIGMISHVIVYKVDADTSPGNVDYQFFNFSGESISNVKNFLVQYCEDRKKEGFWMVQDPYFDFYQALCVGIINDNSLQQSLVAVPAVASEVGFNNGVQITTGGSSNNNQEQYSTANYQQQESADRNGVRRSKINLSKQRERTGKMKLKDFSMYFDLRITDVAEKLNVCPTVVKKKCREAGLNRWPYRKIKGLKRKIKAKRDCLMVANSDAERSQNMLEIQMLEQQLQDIYTKLGRLQM